MVHYQVGAAMERIAVDIMGPLPVTNRGNKFVMVVGDYFTRWTECYAIPDHKAPTVATKLTEEFVARFGIPLNFIPIRGVNLNKPSLGRTHGLHPATLDPTG